MLTDTGLPGTAPVVNALHASPSPLQRVVDSGLLRCAVPRSLGGKGGLDRLHRLAHPIGPDFLEVADLVIFNLALSSELESAIELKMVQEQEAEKAKRIADFAGYTIDADLMKRAKPDAIFMHCLPAYRGYEVSAEVLDGPQSVIWDEAENRLHAQKALMAWLAEQAR